MQDNSVHKVDYKGGRIITDRNLGLKKVHFTVAAMATFIFCECAAGAYGIEEMIHSAAPGLTLIMLCVIPVIWAAPAGLAVAECSNLAPANSGPYVWTKMAFGEFWGFAMGWWMILASYLTPVAYVILAVDYAGKYINFSPAGAFITKTAMIVVFMAINLMGLKDVSLVSTMLTIVILVGFGVVTVVGFMHWNYNPVEPLVPSGKFGFSEIGSAFAVGIWMYAGYAELSPICGEIKNQEVLPKGMILAIVLAVVSYLLPTIAGIASTGHYELWYDEYDFSTVLEQHLGLAGGIGFMIVAVVSQFAIFNAAIAVASRSFTMMVEDNLAPKFLGKLTKTSRVPVWPIIILGVFCMFFVNFDFSDAIGILDIVLFALYIGLGTVTFKLRKLYPTELRDRDGLWHLGGKAGAWYMLLGPLVCGLFAWLISGANMFVLGFIPILIVAVMYIPFKRRLGGLAVRDPKNHPANPKTKLGKGDVGNIGNFCIMFGALAAGGSIFIRFYEGSWGAEYYGSGDVALTGGFLGDFSMMMKVLLIGGIALMVLGAVLRLISAKADPMVKIVP